jgi:hypothetical protein
MRVRIHLLVAACALLTSLVGCVLPLTRTVQDTYTVTTEDTVYVSTARHEPGSPTNGTVYPAPRTTEKHRNVTQYDSTIRKEFPAFIRAGVFESVGLLGSASSGNGIGAGVFGVYYNPADLLSSVLSNAPDATFSGAIYRVGILEYRLRWFKDAANWTVGTSLFETIIPEANSDKVLNSFLPLYLRKRYFLRDDIPYVCVTPTLGIGVFPSQYVNLGASLDVGSIAGLNFRTYLGYVTGVNVDINRRRNTTTTTSVSAPYAGFGISLMDFLNSVQDTETEWKDQPHSGWHIGVMNMSFFTSNTDSSYFGGAFPVKGFQLQALPVSIALPVLNHRLYAGTNLFSLILAGSTTQRINGRNVPSVAIGLGILPLRIGYWQPVLRDELTFEPFVEYSYYPTVTTQIGARLNLFVTSTLNIALTGGYMSSSGFDTSGEFFKQAFGTGLGAFSTAYAGISVNLLDRIFFEEQLRYNRAGER